MGVALHAFAPSSRSRGVPCPDSHKLGEWSPASVWYCAVIHHKFRKPRCLSRTNPNGRRRGRWCTGGHTQHRTTKPVDLIEGPNKVFEVVFEVAAQRVHSCTSTNSVLRGADFPCFWAYVRSLWSRGANVLHPTSQGPSCRKGQRGQGDGTDTWLVATQCPHFGL